MTTDKPIKCASQEYKAAPFFLIQSNGSDKRFVVSFQDVEKIKLFFSSFLNSSKRFQVKIRDYKDYENPIDFSGATSQGKLAEILISYRDIIFHDGYHDLMIRNPDTGEYIAFDEHGLLFIYTTKNYSDILTKMSLEYKANEKLIYEVGHWHYRPANGGENLHKLIEELELQQEKT